MGRRCSFVGDESCDYTTGHKQADGAALRNCEANRIHWPCFHVSYFPGDYRIPTDHPGRRFSKN